MPEPREATPGNPPHRPGRLLGEVGGAFGDLGTLLALVLSAATVGGLALSGVLFGFSGSC